MEDAAAYKTIEDAAAAMAGAGWEPIDAEPGEWIRMRRGEQEIEIRPAA